ncbi:enoyl-CoA hydratase/isomerase family protein [Peterkaempfera sp. SMS 1(5)a]|uniref:enoyl-CoA hydratase/isomerase family protein n=1 Tax=Peterkaempfera podocarpi TaxID=3232308 RepID=UPI00366C9965
MTTTVRYEMADGVATVAMNRPERRNAFSREMIGAVIEALQRAEADDQVRAVVVTGTGGHFSVGRDHGGPVESRFVQGVSVQADRARLLDASRVTTVLYEMNKPTVAEVRGGCAGAGMAIALGCDLRYAADDARFNTAFVDVGFSGDLGMCWLLTQVVGPARARELMLLSPRLTAAEAFGRGLVHEVLPSEELAGRVRAVAARLAGAAPFAVTGARRNLQDALSRSLGDYLPTEADRLLQCAYSPDAEEARLAFLEKRTPHFTGAR